MLSGRLTVCSDMSSTWASAKISWPSTCAVARPSENCPVVEHGRSLSPTLHEDDDGGWLRLAVARDAYLGAKDGCPRNASDANCVTTSRRWARRFGIRSTIG